MSVHYFPLQLSSLSGGHWQLSSVIHRLVFLLPPSHIQRLSTIFGVEQFPVVSAHLSSTGHLDASQLHQYLLQQLTTQISSQASDLFALVRSWCTSIAHVHSCFNIRALHWRVWFGLCVAWSLSLPLSLLFPTSCSWFWHHSLSLLSCPVRWQPWCFIFYLTLSHPLLLPCPSSLSSKLFVSSSPSIHYRSLWLWPRPFFSNTAASSWCPSKYRSAENYQSNQ